MTQTTYLAAVITREETDIRDFLEDDGLLPTLSYSHPRYKLGNDRVTTPSTFLQSLALSMDDEDRVGDLEERRCRLFRRLQNSSAADIRELENKADHRFDARRDKLLRDILDENVVHTPYYLLDHSGLRVSPYPFGDPWDSAQVGIAWVKFERVFEICSAPGLLHSLCPDEVAFEGGRITPVTEEAKGHLEALEGAFATGKPNATLRSAVIAEMRRNIEWMDLTINNRHFMGDVYALDADEQPTRDEIIARGEVVLTEDGSGYTLEALDLPSTYEGQDITELWQEAWDAA